MGSIFLSYRREDSEGQAGRLYDDLVAVFGSDSVFMDVAAIQPGRDFRKSIDQSLNSCGVFLSLIGKSWLTAKDTSGQRRLDDPADFVRIETAAVLKRDIPVIPVLVQGASAPKPDQLPDDLKELAFRNAVELTHARWSSDIQVLIKALRPHISQSGPKSEPERVQAGNKLRATKFLAVIAVLLIIVIGLAFYRRPVKLQKVTGVANAKLPSGAIEEIQKGAQLPSTSQLRLPTPREVRVSIIRLKGAVADESERIKSALITGGYENVTTTERPRDSFPNRAEVRFYYLADRENAKALSEYFNRVLNIATQVNDRSQDQDASSHRPGDLHVYVR